MSVLKHLRAMIAGVVCFSYLSVCAPAASQWAPGSAPQATLGVLPGGGWHPLALDSSYNLQVDCVTGCSGGGGGGGSSGYASSDCSGTITAGGTVQIITGFVHGFEFMNPGASATIWISKFGTAAANASGSIPITSSGSYQTNASEIYAGTVSVFSTTTGAPFTCSRW